MKKESKVDRAFAFTVERTELDILGHQILRNALSAAAWLGFAEDRGSGGGGSPGPAEPEREAIAA